MEYIPNYRGISNFIIAEVSINDTKESPIANHERL